MAEVTGGELVVRTLIAAGVDTIFALHGAHIDPIFQAARDHGLTIIDTRHEAAAGHAAEGYSRARNAVAVAMVTAGPGFTNVVTSLANAYLDRTPVLYLTGAAGLAQAETNTLQAGIDQVAIATPITKWAHQVTLTRDIPRLVGQALRVAAAAPSGPVLIDLPSDVLGARVEEPEALPDTVLLDSRAAPQAKAVQAVLELLADAERPVIMAGVGAARSGAGAALIAFAERAGVPVFSDFAGLGLLPADHPLYAGTYHKMADLDGEDGRPDLVLALGVRFGLFTVGGSDLIVPHAARIVHVEDDAREIGLVRRAEIGIVADVSETLKALERGIGGRNLRDWSGWRATIAEAGRARRARLRAEAAEWTGGRIHPYAAVAAIAGAIPHDTMIVGDGAEAYHWFNETVAQAKPQRYLTHGFLGAVGFGLGLALGAQVADMSRPVLLLVGDGAIGFTIAEFDTMARLNLPIVVVVMNNRSWAASEHFQQLALGPDRVTKTQLGGARYDLVAQGFGCDGLHITDVTKLGPAISAALAARRPSCINVEIDVGPIPPELHLLMRR